jgi:hypothetical protein
MKRSVSAAHSAGSEHCGRQTAEAVGAPSHRDDLLRRLEGALTVRRGRREGEQEARVESEPVRAWRSANGKKGRRLVATDLHSDNRVAAVLAWHFEAKPARGARRPHLIIAAAVRKDLNDLALRSEYLVALWLLVCVAAAIDRKTGQVGRVGLVRDAGIALTAEEIADLGLQRGRMSDGYRGEYYTFEA